MFNFFGEGEHRVFNYKPIYYDKDKERKEDNGTYVPGSYIRRSGIRSGDGRSHLSRTQTIIGIVTLLLIAAVLYLIAKFYTIL